MDQIILIDAKFIDANTIFIDLIMVMKSGFSSKDILVPMRHHHDFPNPGIGPDSTLLLMPAWNPGKEAGIKIATVSPNNGQFNLPSIQGAYIFLDAERGTIKAILEAKSLTAKRTAAASALASYYLSKKDSSSLLMIGTGALSTNLIKAHSAVRPIRKVFVWGRHYKKAQEICEKLKNESYSIYPIKNIEDKISEVDVVSCATLSKTPLILGEYLKEGQHIDLVGAYKTDMREADDATIKKANVFVDTLQGGLKESGDIVIPLHNGIISSNDIKADLFQLCSNEKQGRGNDSEITVFKSVGHALEDLIAAKYYFDQYTSE